MKVIEILASEIVAWVNFILQLLPGKTGTLLRRIYFKQILKKSGKRLSISRNVQIKCASNISVGDNIGILDNSLVSACNNAQINIGNYLSMNGNVKIIADCGGVVTIGDNVMIGPNVVIRSANHIYDSLEVPINRQGHKPGKIIVGDDVWIGANVVVLADVTIGSHAIIAAGAVVTKDIPDYAIAAGIPARVIDTRN